MSYEINTKSDFLTGAALIVKIPEGELDRKALYTIQRDTPEFILPFSSKSIDGQIEFVYQIGSYSKLQYFSGERSAKEYTALWSGVFSPLIDCGDWFMNPYSFILDAEYLYYDKNKKTVCYVYIPSMRGCSSYAALKVMAAEITKFISAEDIDLENKVLRAIMKDFNPNDLLRMLKSYISAKPPAIMPMPAQTPERTAPQPPLPAEPWVAPASVQKPAPSVGCDMRAQPIASTETNYGVLHPVETQPAMSQAFDRTIGAPGDIVITMPSFDPYAKKKWESGDNREVRNGKADKGNKKQKSAGAPFGKKRNWAQETPPATAAAYQPELEPIPNNAHISAQYYEYSGVTQNTSIEVNGSRLTLVGSARLPQTIEVVIEPGEIFTIGRFDTAVGKQQSSFEFERNTKAVSRRHAAIERYEGSYSIIDLASSAGTFLNGHKLPPNTPCELDHGYRVSFGNAGADYMWEAV